MTKKKNTHKGLEVVAVGALVAAAAGAYFLYGTKSGAKTKKKIKGWALKAKGEVLEKLEKSKDISEETYHSIVDSVTGKYAKLASIGSTEIDELTKDLKKHWKNIKREIEKPVSKKGNK